MTDWTKPQPCEECGKMVNSKEKHTFEDCKDWRMKIKTSKGILEQKEIAEARRDNSLFEFLDKRWIALDDLMILINSNRNPIFSKIVGESISESLSPSGFIKKVVEMIKGSDG